MCSSSVTPALQALPFPKPRSCFPAQTCFWLCSNSLPGLILLCCVIWGLLKCKENAEGIVGAGRYKAAAPSCPRKIRAVLWVQPILTACRAGSDGVTNSNGTATSQCLPQARREPWPRLSHCHAASFLTLLSHQSLTFKITISITSLPITVRPEW